MRGYMKTTAALVLVAASAWFGWQLSASASQHSIKSRMVQQSSDPSAQRMDQMQHQPGSVGTSPSGTQGTMEPQQGAMLPQGVTQKNLGDFEDVRKNFTTFAKDALKHDGFKDLTDNFVESDRNRLSGAAGQNNDAWNNAIDQFNQAWKAKYNSNFDVADRDKAYSDRFLAVTQGQVDNPQQITSWPVAPMQKGAENWQKISSSPNIQKGTQVAVVTLTADATQPPLYISLIREGSKWKIDIPDNVSADDLRASLVQHLGQVTSMKDQWPSDPNDAARVVSYHLLTACYTAGQAGQYIQGGSSSNSSGTTEGGTSPMGSTSGQGGTHSDQSATTSSQSSSTGENTTDSNEETQE